MNHTSQYRRQTHAQNVRHSLTHMAIGLALFMWSSNIVAQEAPVSIELAELQTIQPILEQYLTRFRAYDVNYTNDIFRKERGHIASLMRRDLCETLASDSDVRSSKRIVTFDATGQEAPSNKVTMYLHKGRSTVVSNSNSVTIRDVGSSGPIGGMELFQAIGLIVPTTRQTKLSDLLASPNYVFKYQDEVLIGRKTIVLGIGPGIPATLMAGHPAWIDGWMKIWLSVDDQYCPLKLVIYHAADKQMVSERAYGEVPVQSIANPRGKVSEFTVLTYEVLEMSVAFDKAREREIPFPKKIRTESGVISETTCHKVTINPLIRQSDFEAVLPKDAQLTVNGAPVFRDNTSRSIRDRHTANTTAVHKMLAEAIPSTPKQSFVFTMWPWWLVATSCIGFLGWSQMGRFKHG